VPEGAKTIIASICRYCENGGFDFNIATIINEKALVLALSTMV